MTSSSFMPRRQRHKSRPVSRGPVPAVAASGVATASIGSAVPLDEHFLDLRDRLGGIEILRADVGAVHDGVAAVEPEGILELIEPLAGRLVAAVDDPAVGGEQCRRTEEALAAPPVARTGGRAAGTQDAGRRPVDLLLLRLALQPLAVRG